MYIIYIFVKKKIIEKYRINKWLHDYNQQNKINKSNENTKKKKKNHKNFLGMGNFPEGGNFPGGIFSRTVIKN